MIRPNSWTRVPDPGTPMSLFGIPELSSRMFWNPEYNPNNNNGSLLFPPYCLLIVPVNATTPTSLPSLTTFTLPQSIQMCWFLVLGTAYGCRHFTPLRLGATPLEQCSNPKCIMGYTHEEGHDCEAMGCYITYEVGHRRAIRRCQGFCSNCRYMRAYCEGRAGNLGIRE